MQKNYLGLGILFSAADRGFGKGINTFSSGIDRIVSGMKNVGVATGSNTTPKDKKHPFHGIYEGMQLLSLSRIGSTLEDISEAISGKGLGIDDLWAKLDELTTRMRYALDPKTAQQFNSAIMSVMRSTGLTAEQTEILSRNMIDVGANAKDVIKTLPMMGKLVGFLKMDAEQVAKMFGQARVNLQATPEAMMQLVKETVKIQKAYKLTNLTAALPDIFEAVAANSAKFGKVNSEVALRTSRDMVKLVGVFQKIGLSQQQAIGATTKFQTKLADMKRSILDMQAGLEPMDEDIFKFAETLTVAGIDGNEAMNMIMEAGDNPQKLVDELNKRMGQLDEGTQYAVTARLRRIFGDEVANMVGAYREDATKAVTEAEKQEEKLGTASEEFDKLSGAMQGTIGVQKSLTEAAKDFFELSMKWAHKKDIVKALNLQANAWDRMGKKIKETDGFLGWLLDKLFMFKEMGLTGIFQTQWMADMGVFAGFLGTLILPLATLIGLFKIFAGPLKMIGSLFKWILHPMKTLAWIADSLGVAFRFITRTATGLFRFGKVLFSIGKVFMKLLAPLDLVYMVWRDWSSLMERMSFDNILGSMSEFGHQATKWIGELLDDLFFGIPSMISQAIAGVSFAEATDALAYAFEEMIDSLVDVLAGWWYSLSEKAMVVWDRLTAWFSEFWEGIKSIFASFWNGSISDALLGWWNGLLGKGMAVWDAIVGKFKAVWDKVKGLFTGAIKFLKDMVGGFIKYLVSLPDQVLKFFSTMWDKVKGVLSQMWEAMRPFREMFSNLIGSLTKPFDGLGDALAQKLSGLKDIFKEVIDKLWEMMPDWMKTLLSTTASIAGQAAEYAGRLLNKGKSLLGMGGDEAVAPKPKSETLQAEVVQEGAPLKSAAGAAAAAVPKPSLSDKNFQAVVDSVYAMKDEIAGLLEELAKRPVMVQLKGDAKKFFAAANSEGNKTAGAMGLAGAAGG